MMKGQTPQQSRPATSTAPRPLDKAQLEQVVGGFSAGASKGRGGKSVGASGNYKY
jgi:hypothetical protein